MRSFTIDVNGHRYQATWKATGRDQIEVRSDYGSSYVTVGDREPSVAAREALATIVAARLRQFA